MPESARAEGCSRATRNGLLLADDGAGGGDVTRSVGLWSALWVSVAVDGAADGSAAGVLSCLMAISPAHDAMAVTIQKL